MAKVIIDHEKNPIGTLHHLTTLNGTQEDRVRYRVYDVWGHDGFYPMPEPLVFAEVSEKGNLPISPTMCLPLSKFAEIFAHSTEENRFWKVGKQYQPNEDAEPTDIV